MKVVHHQIHPLSPIIKDQYNGLNFLYRSNKNEKNLGGLTIQTIHEWECHGENDDLRE